MNAFRGPDSFFSISYSSLSFSAASRSLSREVSAVMSAGVSSLISAPSSFTSSGSAPLKALVEKEAGIALCMTYQAANKINEGVNLQIIEVEGGHPWTSDGTAIIKGHETDAVKAVFNYLFTDVVYEDAKIGPEHGLADMSGRFDHHTVIGIASVFHHIGSFFIIGIGSRYSRNASGSLSLVCILM